MGNEKPISHGRTESKTPCRSCGGKMYDGYDKKMREWFIECTDCGMVIWPDVLRGVF